MKECLCTWGVGISVPKQNSQNKMPFRQLSLELVNELRESLYGPRFIQVDTMHIDRQRNSSVKYTCYFRCRFCCASTIRACSLSDSDRIRCLYYGMTVEEMLGWTNRDTMLVDIGKGHRCFV